MMSEPFRIAGRAGAKGNVHILSVRGAITNATSPAFDEAARAANAKHLILDLSEVPAIDSMAIGSLVRAYVSCNKTGRKLALVGLSHHVKNVLRMTGVAPLFETYTSVAEAEASLT
ncbi:MAG TPA: STAS domain-containing protein [Candidatus Acidoferrales bacterium]|nr:STAS domain-containing protein [Candidatus Acidoferrales bacterium]